MNNSTQDLLCPLPRCGPPLLRISGSDLLSQTRNTTHTFGFWGAEEGMRTNAGKLKCNPAMIYFDSIDEALSQQPRLGLPIVVALPIVPLSRQGNLSQ